MGGRDESRYPHEHITRDRLGPTAAAHATVLDRDDRTCLAHNEFASFCAGDISVESVLTDPTDVQQRSPLFLRTFCAEHAHWDGPPGLRAAWTRIRLDVGWLIPAVPDPASYARGLPVLYPGGSWWLLDDWGERRQITTADVTRLRAEIRKERP